MRNEIVSKRSSAWARLAVVAVLAVGALCSLQAAAQVPARFYWDTLSGGNAVPLLFNSISGNTNPFDPSHTPMGDASFDGTLAMVGYAHTFSLGNRSAMAAVILPMGRVSSDVTVAGNTVHESARGYGDPMLEFKVNLIGPPAQKSIPDAMRYEPKFSLNVLADLALPIGEYDSDQSLNVGQNRWYGRIGFPIVWQLGSWVPGRRTTLEFLPAVWLFGSNNDFMGQTMETDPMFQLDAHLTRDFTEHLWGAFDAAWYNGGKATIAGVEGEKMNNIGVGLTLGYQINDNVALTFGYKSTINDSAPSDLKMDGFMVSLVFGWHPIIEGSKRLKGGE